MTLKRIIGVLVLVMPVALWIAHAENHHQTVQRTLPEINAALDKITDKLEKAEIEKQHTAHLCRCGKIIDRALCASVGVNLPDGG